METIMLFILIIVFFVGVVGIINALINGDNEIVLKNEQKTSCNREDYSYKLRLKK